MEPRKQAICDALAAFIHQRPGLEFANYGDSASYRSESRSITRDRDIAVTLLNAVRWREGITADALIEAAQHAYSGRLTLKDCRATYADGSVYHKYSVNYCTGQYFPTEYRRAVAAVLASALWDWTRDNAMPPVDGYKVRCLDDSGMYADATRKTFATRADADAYMATVAESRRAYVVELHKGKSPGDWLRDHFRKEFGARIASRFFN